MLLFFLLLLYYINLARAQAECLGSFYLCKNPKRRTRGYPSIKDGSRRFYIIHIARVLPVVHDTPPSAVPGL